MNCLNFFISSGTIFIDLLGVSLETIIASITKDSFHYLILSLFQFSNLYILSFFVEKSGKFINL